MYEGRTFICICKNCKQSFKSVSNTTILCNDCLEYKTCNECGNLTEDLYPKKDNHIHLCNKCSNKYKRISRNICKLCNKEFFAESNRKFYCKNCLKHPVCNRCGKSLDNFISINDNSIYYCSKKCSNQNKAEQLQKPGECIICKKFVQHRDALGQGIECGCLKNHLENKRNNNLKPGICVTCKNFSEFRDFLGRCKSCHDKWYDCNNHLPNVREAGDRNLKEFHHNGCFNCFKEIDGILYYFDSNEDNQNNYIPWEDYKQKFLKISQERNNFIDEIKNQYPLFKIIPTFRSQDSVDWSGARTAFEQSLIDEKINWFVYIKFDELNRPLVVGKSGSLNVNCNGSDVSFSADVNDGPARKFLFEEGINWNKTKILILPIQNEKEAYKIEKEIQENYNLFGS